ncbi:MAG: anaerobic magnesium-protoporphyrin monomethyl ester cyclase [Candidatus Binatota bacterium]|nr:anaerobic magnesium-protoporphyrin monomethyl ester cyclase [Candidatus Binatota bacterium]
MKIKLVHVLINQPGKLHSPPLGALYLAAVLRQNGFEIELADYGHLRGTPLRSSDLTRVLDDDADVVAVSCMINVLPLLLRSLQELRRNRPHKKIVVGGPGFGGIASELVCRFDCIDAVAVGESESIIVPLMRALENRRSLHDVPGIEFRENGAVVSTPRPPLIAELDDIPLPAFEMVTIGDYQHVGIEATRGCPFHCTFCDVAPAWLRKHRTRSPENVIREMSILSRNGVGEVAFVDDLFVIDQQWVRSFCRSLLRSGVRMQWRCNAHINLVRDEGLLQLMQDAGCDCIFFGIESGSDRVLAAIKKGFTVAKALKAVERAAKYFEIETNLIWGFPFETGDDVRSTLDLQARLEELGVSVGLCMAIPLADSDLYAASRADIRFSPAAPNMLYMDYRELVDEEREPIERIITDNPHALSAFHHFANPRLREHLRIVDARARRGQQAEKPGPETSRQAEEWFDF